MSPNFLPRRLAAFAFVTCALLSVAGAQAADPAAIVEEADTDTGLAPMDYLQAGRKFTLKSGQAILIGYLSSCVREHIVGGSVVIGAAQSTVSGGEVSRDVVACAGTAVEVTSATAESGVIVFRKPVGVSGTVGHPVIHGQQPVFRVQEPGTITVRRLDVSASTLELEIPGRALDLAETDVMLSIGGTYQAESHGSAIVFEVARDARPGKVALLSRLIAF